MRLEEFSVESRSMADVPTSVDCGLINFTLNIKYLQLTIWYLLCLCKDRYCNWVSLNMSVLQETRLWVSAWTKIVGVKISGATQRQHFSLRLLMSFPVFSISFKNHLKDNIVHLGLVESIFIIRNKHVRCRRKFSMHFTKENSSVSYR